MTINMRSLVEMMLLGCLAAVVAGCSGGGGSGGDETATATASEGPISGFGSVIMNGVRWNTDDAVFEINGQFGTQDDLSLGMVVRVEGRRSARGSAKAERVIFESRIRGPIRNVEILGPDTKELTVFGLHAFVSRADTRFDNATLDGLSAGQMVELSGFVNAEGVLEASHLRGRGTAIVGVSEVKVSGEVAGLSGGSFVIGTSEVLFSGDTELDDFGPLGLRDGLQVRVEGVLLANDAIDAEEIESQRRRGEDDDFDEFEFQGIVSEFVSISDFRVADRAVDASGALLIPNDPDLLREGVRVEVEGRYDANGVLIADKLKFRSNRVRIEAELASDLDVDLATGQVFLLGIPIQVDGGTRIEDKRDDVDPFGLGDLRGGDFVELRGLSRSDGSVTATRLERERGDDLSLRGPVDMIDIGAREFTILGVLIRTGASTQFKDDHETILSADEFFDRLRAGMTVKAKDREDGDETDFDVASEIELEQPDLEDDDDDDDDDDRDDEDEDDVDDDQVGSDDD